MDIERDIVVNTEEWDEIMEKIRKKDEAVAERLSEFIYAVNILANDGFAQGKRHEEAMQLLTELNNISTMQNGLYKSINKAVQEIISAGEAVDKF